MTRIADDDAHLKAIFELDHATNERLLAENNLPAGIGIHELVFEVPENQVETAKPMIKNAMENAATLSVPLTVEIGAGKHWGEAH